MRPVPDTPPDIAFSAMQPAHRGAPGRPQSSTIEQARGFGLYLLHAVLSARGDEVLDLAETNLVSRLFS